jgi:hypothetical protein
MTGELRAPLPLRPSDPRRLGPYELLGRLGEGGMGTVYLASGPQGVPVAVKMVRADLDMDGEFRRRFRSEVNRARQVPPFCTAEVLDADPDHEHPYLVVEYVDAPSLAQVVQERGPLSAANLHSVAIGVATALTAIHGAGVIHRDLKPRNVLLAPGSPKVIDFGIARAMEATSAHTRTDQMVGTVAYMAPERFGSEVGMTLTPAADVFAWGAVVGYAGTGRTPFSADSPPATAARILTQPPDLSGLSGPLRSLVGHSLEKEPQDRPTARELLDMLLASGPQRSAATAAALAHQPGLRAAAREAQAATDYASARQLTALVAPLELSDDTTDGDAGPWVGTAVPVESATGRVTTGRATTTTGTDTAADQHTALIRAARPDAQSTEVHPVRPRVQIPAQASSAPISPAGPSMLLSAAAPAVPEPKRRWVFPLAILLLIGAVVGGIMLINTVNGFPDPKDTTIADPDRNPPAPPVDPVYGPATISDSLMGPRLWTAARDKKEKAECGFDSGLAVKRDNPGTYRCDGPDDMLADDQRVDVGVRLLTKGSCASVWFRFQANLGYQARVCHDRVLVGWHKSTTVKVLRTIYLDEPFEVGSDEPRRITITAKGAMATIEIDGRLLGMVPLKDPDILGGKIALGIYNEQRGTGESEPYRVIFTDVDIWSLDA